MFITKMINDKRRYRRFKARVAALPTPYRDAVKALERYIYHLGGIGDGDSILEMLDDLADLFERAAVDQTPVRDIVGEDPVEFIEAFLANYPSGGWITREQKRLNKAIDNIESADTRGAS